MATKAKVTAKPVAAAAVEEEAAAFQIGDNVRFLGYAPDTPEDEQQLTAGEIYSVVAFTEADGDNPGGDPVLAIENPEYNPKKKEDADTNPKTLEIQVFATEIELAEEEAEVEEEAAPVAAKTAAKAAPAKAATKAAPAKAAAKEGKKAKPAKAAKPVKVAKPPKEPEVDELDVDLETEDAEVLALIEGAENLIETAQQIEAESAKNEWQLGGLLFHIRKDKTYTELEGGEEYKTPGGKGEPSGFEKFLKDYFNIEYRKAMYLIKIYVAFSKAGIEDAAARVAAMGWTKAKTIAPAMLEGSRDANELVELADNNTVEDLATAVKDQTTVGGTKGEKVKRLTLKFRFVEAEAAGINAILETAKSQLALKTLDEALAAIVNEWASANGGGKATRTTAPVQKVAAKAAPVAAPKAPVRRVAAAAH